MADFNSGARSQKSQFHRLLGSGKECVNPHAETLRQKDQVYIGNPAAAVLDVADDVSTDIPSEPLALRRKGRLR